MSEKEWKPETSVYTPQEVAAHGLAQVSKIKRHESLGLNVGIPTLDGYFAPVMPGQLITVQAQTHQYKSGFMRMWARNMATQLNEQERFDECIVFVSVEECIEEQAFYEFAHYSEEDPEKLARGEYQDWAALERAYIKIGQIPIYRIGDSLARPEDLPQLYLSNVIRAIQKLIEIQHKSPAAIFVDYLHALPIDPDVMKLQADKRRNMQVREDVYRLRKASTFFSCPVIVGAQAKQQLDTGHGQMPIPGMYDAQDTSAIAQRSDRIISLWMPKVTHTVGQKLSFGPIDFTVEEDMIWIKVVKQRGGLQSGRAWPCRIDFRNNTIRPERIETVRL